MKFTSAFTIALIALFFTTRMQAQSFQYKDGLKYEMLVSKNGKKPAIGEVVSVDMMFYGDNDSLVFSSVANDQPVTIPVSKPQFKGDLMTGIMMLGVGDSAVFLISSDSIRKLSDENTNVKPGVYLKYIIKLKSIFNPKDQGRIDDSLIKVYLKDHKIKGTRKTASGIYYKITKKGKGPNAKEHQTVTAHYAGRFLDGKEFDSDKGAGISFELGVHQVITGWDEAFELLNKGAKATIFLPSASAYGITGGGPIPPNAILIFDVELADIK
jgi:FKBP-type peptidyl-prolyl cis-trans isomerase FkpA